MNQWSMTTGGWDILGSVLGWGMAQVMVTVENLTSLIIACEVNSSVLKSFGI